MRVGLLIILLLSITFSSSAQFYKLSELDTIKEYKSLEEALKNPDAVIRLSLKGSKIKTVPKEVFIFKNLQELNLKKTKIDILPKEIGDLKNLQILDVSKNKLVTLPIEIGELINLKILKASENELEYLPIEIGKLIELRFLDLWSNNLSGLPDEMSELIKLKKIDMRVIQYSEREMKEMKELLPNTEIIFSKSCNCD
jgi:Leucine-rich repeat (LRR) protein